MLLLFTACLHLLQASCRYSRKAAESGGWETETMEFLYTKNQDGVCVDKVTEPETEVYIPERLAGLPVTELGAYVLSGSAVEAVHLPPQVRKIGAYAFYGCEKLREVWCYGRAVDLGTGLFADDRQIGFVDLTLFAGERSCMKELLQEIRQTLRVQLHEIPEGAGAPEPSREARLIFPEYFEESVENTPARKVVVETHGCGQRYRYCFARREFQYADYDALFAHMQVQESEELSAELAVGRLRYPRELGKRSRERYEAYLREHWEAAARILLQADRLSRTRATNLTPGLLPWFAEEILADGQAEPELSEKLVRITVMAQELGDTEMVSCLMDYAHKLRSRDARQQPQDAADGAGTAAQAGGSPERAEPQRRRRRFEL